MNENTKGVLLYTVSQKKHVTKLLSISSPMYIIYY